LDPNFRAGLARYIEHSRAKIARIEEKLAPWRDGSSPLIVWGTGQLTLKLLAETSLGSAKIVAFVDSNPINQGKTLAGRPVCAPSEIKDRAAPILVATMLHHKEISATIRGRLQLPNPIVTLNP